MTNPNHPRLQSLVGKAIIAVTVGTSHGDGITLQLGEKTKVEVCTYDPVTIRKASARPMRSTWASKGKKFSSSAAPR